MILPAAAWRIMPGLAELLAALATDDGGARAVGGAVRDTLLGLPVADLDLATPLAPEQVLERLAAAGIRAVPTGLAHGTVTAILPGGPVEVTTLRLDVETDGRHARVRFTDDWQADAARRDFTINALFADPRTGALFDWFDGLGDLAAGRVRFIGEAAQRIAEDRLRVLRFFRFQARFGRGEPDAAALAACATAAGTLDRLSVERVAGELLKLLAVANPLPALHLMADTGVLAAILPEAQPPDFARLARLLAREDEAVPLRRLAALLPADPAVALGAAMRLKLSRAGQRRLAGAATAPDDAPRALAHAAGLEQTWDRLLLHADDGPLAAARASLAGWVPPMLPIGGGDLVALGLPRGPLVAQTLAAITATWVAEDFPDEERVRAIAAAAIAQARTR